LRPFSRLQSLNKNKLYTKNVCEDLNFAMMFKTVATCIGGGSRGAETTYFGGILRFKPQPAPTNPTKLSENIYFGAL